VLLELVAVIRYWERPPLHKVVEGGVSCCPVLEMSVHVEAASDDDVKPVLVKPGQIIFPLLSVKEKGFPL
jgi:hypothetical protein